MITVDNLRVYWQPSKPGGERYFGEGKQSCHMSCDGDLEALHAFAEKIGLRREWFQDHRAMPHYDLSPNKRLIAINSGAVAMTSTAQLSAWRESQGLPKVQPLVFGVADPHDYAPKTLRNNCLVILHDKEEGKGDE